ncbi:MAG: hypothetical protein OEY01_05980 [Desulfobulbaceae bacterium]|nr:hypothetical protein [Desulfobulbaceae bacterium]HIJ78659.1 hypothetical protein [Deltaproteobacteria bacterium]
MAWPFLLVNFSGDDNKYLVLIAFSWKFTGKEQEKKELEKEWAFLILSRDNAVTYLAS